MTSLQNSLLQTSLNWLKNLVKPFHPTLNLCPSPRAGNAPFPEVLCSFKHLFPLMKLLASGNNKFYKFYNNNKNNKFK